MMSNLKLKTQLHKLCSILALLLLTAQQANGFSIPKNPLSAQTNSFVANAQVGLRSRPQTVMFMSDNSEEKESTPEEAKEPDEDETEATTTGLIIPGFSDQVEPTPEPPAKKKPEPPKKKEKEVVSKEEAISKAETVISEATKSQPAMSGGGFKNPFANKSEGASQAAKPKPPAPPTPPKTDKKLTDNDVSPLDLMKLVRGETTAKAVEEKAQQQPVVPKKEDSPSISLPKIGLPFQKPKQPTPPPPPEKNDPISSAIGGALTGAAIGLYTNVATDFLYDTDLPPIVPPAALGVAIAATAYTGANQSNFVGKLSSFVFGGPIRSVKNFFVKKVEDTVDNIKATPGRIKKGVEDKIEETVEDIKATPGKIADAIEDKIEETVDEIKATPGKVAESIEKKVEETVKDIEETVEEVISLPGKKIDEVSTV